MVYRMHTVERRMVKTKCDNKNQPREHSVNRKDLQAKTLLGLNWENPVLDPLAVQHLDNPLSMN